MCSVAISHEGGIIYHDEDFTSSTKARALAPMTREALSFADSHGIPLDYVAVSAGPGSYTGLRIGCSMAKGICYGRKGVRLTGIPTLKILTVPLLLYRDDLEEDALLCPMIDARRMEVYCAVYDRSLRELMPTRAMVVESGSFDAIGKGRPMYFMGNGAAKCKDVIKRQGAKFIDGVAPLAKNMLPLAQMAIKQGDFKDIAYFEPFYLKDFVATKPRKLI